MIDELTRVRYQWMCVHVELFNLLKNSQDSIVTILFKDRDAQ